MLEAPNLDAPSLEAPHLEAPNVDELLKGELGTWLNSQKQLRDDTRRKMWRIGIGGGAALLFIVVLFAAIYPTASILALIIGGSGLAAWIAGVRRPIVTAMKDKMNQAIAAVLHLDYALSGEPGPDWQLARDVSLVPNYDEENYEDFWSGTVNGIALRLFEAHLKEWQQHGKNRRLVTVFRGVIIEFAYGRPFHGTTLIERTGTRFQLFGLIDTIDAAGVRLEHVEFTHPQLNDYFDLWTSDPVEAHYLVHPLYVERLLGVERQYGGKKVRALFHDGRMTIAIETEPQFESGSLEAEQDAQRMKQTVQQFMSVAKLADSLYDAPGKLTQ